MLNLTEESQRLREEAERCSREHLIDTLVAVWEDRAQLTEMTKHGFYVPLRIQTRVNQVFTDPMAASRITKTVYRNAVRMLEVIVDERESAAITGAMRWYWSQEAPITSSYSVRI